MELPELAKRSVGYIFELSVISSMMQLFGVFARKGPYH
jgi:hypothetical protein